MPDKNATSDRTSPTSRSAQKGAGGLLIVLGLIGLCTGSFWSMPAFEWLGGGLETYPITLLLPFTPVFLILFGARTLVGGGK